MKTTKYVSIVAATNIAAVYVTDGQEKPDFVQVVLWGLTDKGRVVGLTTVDNEIVAVDELDDFQGYALG